jgi:hypothetical protein
MYIDASPIKFSFEMGVLLQLYYFLGVLVCLDFPIYLLASK